MNLDTAFNTLQSNVNVDPDDLKEARARRDIFCTTLNSESDVEETFASGSLARGTHKDPVHDVDVVVVYDASAHPTWGQPGESAAQALDFVGRRVNLLLGATNGTVAQRVRLAVPRNHCVKCFLDDPEDPDAFTVDVMPALRQSDKTLLIPEKRSDRWIPADPQDLIRRVAKRHADWNEFAKLVRVLKHWGEHVDCHMKGLTIEVLALTCLPEDVRDVALMRYFTAAHVAIGLPICDPAGLCGPIEPDLDVEWARRKLAEARDVATRAVQAEALGATDEAMCLWRQIFGDKFPEPASGCNGGTRVAAVPLVRTQPRRVRDAPQG